jgi:lysophospholipase L1-like esterase
LSKTHMATSSKSSGKERIANFLASLGLSLLSVMIVILAGECVTRVLYSNRLDYQIEMSRYAALLKRPATNPLMSHVHIPNSEAVLMGVPVRINSHGFRDPEYPVAKPADTFRILLLGDSLTFGWGVRASDRFSTLLEQDLSQLVKTVTGKKLHIVNTGIGNYNTVQEVNLFRDIGRKFKPDLVILNFFINDAEDIPTKRAPAILKYSYFAMWLWGRFDTIGRMSGRQLTYRDYYTQLYEEDHNGWINARQALAELKQLSLEDRFHLMVTILPELHEVGNRYGFASIHSRISRAAQQAGADGVLDVADVFTEETTPESLWVSPGDAHPNAMAHRIIASALAQFLVAHTELLTNTEKKEDGQ